MNTVQLKFSQLRNLIIADIQADIAPLLLGRAGIGKSSLLRSLEKDFKTKVFSIAINQLGETSDLTGLRPEEHIDPKTNKKRYRMAAFPHAVIDECMEYAEKHPDETPILFMDEFNRTTPAITSAILSFTTERRIGSMHFPSNIRFVLAGNDTGNINVIDEASITRFSIYRVAPDTNTFLNVQPDLNKHIYDLLVKKPNLLVCDEQLEAIAKVTTITTDKDNDDDDDEEYGVTLDEALGFENEGFSQLTVPRTITAASKFLTQLGIDKSGNNKEKEALKQYMETITDDEGNTATLLLAGLIAHTGTTAFTKELNEEIVAYFQSMTLSGTQTQIITNEIQKIRPKQEYINTLSKVQTNEELIDLIDSMDVTSQGDMLVWLFDKSNIQEVNNYEAVQLYISKVASQLNVFSNQHIGAITSLTTNIDAVDSKIITEALNQSGPAINTMAAVLNMLA